MKIAATLKFILIITLVFGLASQIIAQNDRSWKELRNFVTTDGEIDDQCSMIRFLLYTNEWDVKGIVTSSSQYHWQGHREFK